MTTAPASEEYLTLREAAAELRDNPRVSQRTLARYAKNGHVKTIKVGTRYRISRTEVERIRAEGLGKAARA